MRAVFPSLGLSVALLSYGCGGSSEKRKASFVRDAGADARVHSDGSATSTGGGTGAGGSPDRARDGEAPADASNSTDGADGLAAPDSSLNETSDGGLDGAPDGSREASDSGVASIALPNVDGGPGCIPPSIGTALSPSKAGLPSTGPALWLRVDRGVYMTAANRVCAWVDQSGNGSVFRDATSGQPLFIDASVGGQAGIQFSSASGPMTVGGVLGIPPTAGRTFITVVKLVDTAARFQAVMQGQSGTPGTYVNLDANTYGTAGSREGVYATNNAYDSNLTTSAAPRVHVFTVSTLQPGVDVLASIGYRVNGADESLTRTSGGLGNGKVEDFSQANFTLVGSDGTAILAEALIYDHALNPGERTQVEHALEARYQIVP